MEFAGRSGDIAAATEPFYGTDPQPAPTKSLPEASPQGGQSKQSPAVKNKSFGSFGSNISGTGSRAPPTTPTPAVAEVAEAVLEALQKSFNTQPLPSPAQKVTDAQLHDAVKKISTNAELREAEIVLNKSFQKDETAVCSGSPQLVMRDQPPTGDVENLSLAGSRALQSPLPKEVQASFGQNLAGAMTRDKLGALNKEMVIDKGIQLLPPNHNEPYTYEEKRNIFVGFLCGALSIGVAITLDATGAAQKMSDMAQRSSCENCPRACELPALSGTMSPSAAAALAPAATGTIKCPMEMFGAPKMFGIPLVWLGGVGGCLSCWAISWFAGWCQDSTPHPGDRVVASEALVTQNEEGNPVPIEKGTIGNVVRMEGKTDIAMIQWDGTNEARPIDSRDFDRLRPVEGACNADPVAGEEAHAGRKCRGPLAYVRRKVNYSRKITHCTGYIINVLVRFVFGAGEEIETPASLIFTSAFIMVFWHLFLLKSARKRWVWCRVMFAGMDRPEDRPYTLEWLTTQNMAYFGVWVPITYALVALDKYQLSLITVLVLAFGDGLAEPVGVKFGKHKYQTKAIWAKDKDGNGKCCWGEFTRSYEGSAVVFLATVISIGICYPWFDNVKQFGCSMATLPLAMTLSEAWAPHSWDNPFLTGIGGGLLILILHVL